MLKFSTNKLTSSHLNKSGQVHNCKVFKKQWAVVTIRNIVMAYSICSKNANLSSVSNVMFCDLSSCYAEVLQGLLVVLCKIISCVRMACSSLVNSEHLVHMSIILYCDVLMS